VGVLVAAKAVITDEVSAPGTPDTPRVKRRLGAEGQMSARQGCPHGMSAAAHHPEGTESRSSFWEGVHDSKDVDDVS